MKSKIEFSFNEINALNKLLSEVKREPSFTADDLHFFALSPFIISAFKKIHNEYNRHINSTIKNDISPILDETEIQFQLSDNSYIGNWKQRILDLGETQKKLINGMNDKEKNEYCELMFAPFKPTDKIRQEVFNFLTSIKIQNTRK